MEECKCENNPSDRLHVTLNHHQKKMTRCPTKWRKSCRNPAVNVITGKLLGFHQQEPSLVNHRRKTPLGMAPILCVLKLQHCAYHAVASIPSRSHKNTLKWHTLGMTCFVCVPTAHLASSAYFPFIVVPPQCLHFWVCMVLYGRHFNWLFDV